MWGCGRELALPRRGRRVFSNLLSRRLVADVPLAATGSSVVGRVWFQIDSVRFKTVVVSHPK